MAGFSSKTETAERIVFRIAVPTDIVSLSKAMASASKKAGELAEKKNNHLYDDDVIVEADEEEIRLVITTKDWS